MGSIAKMLLAFWLALLVMRHEQVVTRSHGQLLVHFYDTSCPRAEDIVQQTVFDAQKKDPSIPAKLLRLLFHDCFVRGCDASVLLDSTPTSSAEKSATASATLEGFEIIDQAKATLEDVCKGTVSCADILALAARDAIVASGGPNFNMPTGRLDGLASVASEVSSNIPDPSSSLDHLLAMFEGNGLSQTDLVFLLGGHTIGVARCGAFSDRFSSNNGTMVVDPTLDPAFAQSLEAACPSLAAGGSLGSATVPLDALTSTRFDNAYYINLQKGKGLLTADEVLFTDARTKPLVQMLAQDASVFFANFPPALIKLSSIGVVTASNTAAAGQKGQIRTNCRLVNSQ